MRSGQSLAEFAVALPIFLLLVLGAANLGLAIRARIQLSQVAQQAAQMLVHNPEYADPLVVTFTGASGGTFTLTTSGGTGGTASFTYSNTLLTAATVRSALEALPDVGVGNVLVSGNAGGPFTVKFVGSATATGLTVDDSLLTGPSGAGGAEVTPPLTLMAYMNSLSSYQLTPSEVTFTPPGTSTEPPGSACTPAYYCALQYTVQINYPFPLLFPMIGKLSVGLLRNGTINLGTTESTVAATHPVTDVSVCYTGSTAPATTCTNGTTDSTLNQHVISWTAPVETQPAPAGVSLPIENYCITAYYHPTSLSSPQPADLPVPNTTANGCLNTATSVGTSLNCNTAPPSGPSYCVDTTNYSVAPNQAVPPYQVLYRVAAQQANGVTSAYSDQVGAP